MRAVTGEIASSQPISLSKAAAVLSRFAASETGARQDVAAYLRRAATAFEELVSVHQDIRAQRKMSLLEEKEAASPQEEDDSSRKKTKKKKGMYYEAVEAVEYSILERQAERDSGGRKKVKVLGSSLDGRFASAMLEADGTVDVKKECEEEKRSIVGIVEKANGAVEKKKKDKKKEVEEKRKDEVKIEERRRKKEKKKREGRIEEDFDSENMDRKRKKRRRSDAEQGGVNGEMEQHEGEKKKKRRTVE